MRAVVIGIAVTFYFAVKIDSGLGVGMQINRRVLFERLLYFAIFVSIMSVSLYFAIDQGITKKSMWERGYSLLAGGGVGAVAGWGLFAVVGTIGFVAGPAFFGALGAGALMAIGALGGVGVGAVLDTGIRAAKNPERFNINYGLIFLIMAVGLIVALLASHFAIRMTRRFRRAGEERDQ